MKTCRCGAVDLDICPTSWQRHMASTPKHLRPISVGTLPKHFKGCPDGVLFFDA